MPTTQTTYTASIPVGFPGMRVNGELCNVLSRTVESAAGLGFGQPCHRGADPMGVIVGTTQAGEATNGIGAGNTGNGVLGTVTVSAGAMEGRYTLEVVEPGANVGEFVVRNPNGVTIGSGTVASAFSAGGLAFTLADGATDFAAGDFFTIDVEFSANSDFVGISLKDNAVIPDATTPDEYPQYATAAIMDKGVIWVTAGAGGVTDGAPAYWNPATSKFTMVTTHVVIPNGKFESNGADGDIVKLRIR